MNNEFLKRAPGFYVNSSRFKDGYSGFYNRIPDEISTVMNFKLTGNARSLLEAYMSINAEDGSFAPSELWVYRKTSLYGNTYYRARKELIEFGQTMDSLL